MKIKTALLSATLALTVALATACGPAETNQPPTAPETAECLEENYRTYRSVYPTERSTFALVMCLNNPVVQAELEELDVDLQPVDKWRRAMS